MTHIPRIDDYSKLHNHVNTSIFLEKRMDYDGSNNMIYVGYSQHINADPAVDTWYIVKLIYDVSNNLTRYELPSGGVAFKYIWNSRTTYFI